MALLTDKNNLSARKSLLEPFSSGIHPRFGAEYFREVMTKREIEAAMGLDELTVSAFERELNELQEDFEALDAANGDFNIAFGSFSGGYTDEQVDEMNRLKEEEDIVSGMMAGLLEQLMLEEDQAFMDITMPLNEYPISTLRVVSTPIVYEHLGLCNEIPFPGTSTLCALGEVEELRVNDDFWKWKPHDVVSGKKILTSRSEGRVAFEQFNQHIERRHKNHGKKIISSRD